MITTLDFIRCAFVLERNANPKPVTAINLTLATWRSVAKEIAADTGGEMALADKPYPLGMPAMMLDPRVELFGVPINIVNAPDNEFSFEH